MKRSTTTTTVNLFLYIFLICFCNVCLAEKIVGGVVVTSPASSFIINNNNFGGDGLVTTTTMTRRSNQYELLSLSNKRQQRQRQRNKQILIEILRGGASKHLEEEEPQIDISSSDNNNCDNIILTKTRNIIRSLLKLFKNKSPTLYKVLKSVIRKIESIFNIKLLPSPSKKKKKQKIAAAHGSSSSKKTRKKKKKKLSSELTMTEKEEEGVESKVAAAPQKKKKKSSNTTTKKKKSAVSAAASAKQKAAAQLSKVAKASSGGGSGNFRIQKELKEFIKSPPTNISVKVGSNIRVWIVTLKGATGTIYEGETFKLRVSFPKNYPIVPPSVYFLPKPAIPKHEHVYTNGDICLSLLGDGWRPNMTAQSIAISILSILSSATKKELPMDNARHSQNKPGQYQKDWVYHDDNC